VTDELRALLHEGEAINKKLYEQREAWIKVCGKAKEILTDFDHVNDDPIHTLSVVNDLLDNAFSSNIVEFVEQIEPQDR